MSIEKIIDKEGIIVSTNGNIHDYKHERHIWFGIFRDGDKWDEEIKQIIDTHQNEDHKGYVITHAGLNEQEINVVKEAISYLK